MREKEKPSLLFFESALETRLGDRRAYFCRRKNPGKNKAPRLCLTLDLFTVTAYLNKVLVKKLSYLSIIPFYGSRKVQAL